MRKVVILAFVALGVLGVGAVATADDDDGSGHNGARMNGYQEVTSVSTTGVGSFFIKFNKDMTADYVLSYRDIETPDVTQAHIHFAQRAGNGPIEVWLCHDGDPAAAPNPPGPPGAAAVPDLPGLPTEAAGRCAARSSPGTSRAIYPLAIAASRPATGTSSRQQ